MDINAIIVSNDNSNAGPCYYYVNTVTLPPYVHSIGTPINFYQLWLYRIDGNSCNVPTPVGLFTDDINTTVHE